MRMRAAWRRPAKRSAKDRNYLSMRMALIRANKRSNLLMHFPRMDVSWFEEPVSSDDLEGLRLIRDEGPAGMDIAAGEYGYDLSYFRRMLEAGAVDVLQADATRCGGITGFLATDALCEARISHYRPIVGHRCTCMLAARRK